MIVVEIPAALAADPQVVPVAPLFSLTALAGHRVALAWRETCPTCDGDGFVIVEDDERFGTRPCLCGGGAGPYGERPCSRCGGTGVEMYEQDPRRQAQCPDCSKGERMVVGWTAEVEAVLPIVAEQEFHDQAAVVVCIQYAFDVKIPTLRRSRLVMFVPGHDGTGSDLDALFELADWSPGRYALVLRDRWPFGPTDDDYPWTPPSPCRLFSGFAELDEVLR